MNINNLAGRYEKLKIKTKGHSYLSFTDNSSINIEYCREIIKFEENIIVIKLAKNNVKIIGLSLKMRNFSDDCVCVSGNIHSVIFEN